MRARRGLAGAFLLLVMLGAVAAPPGQAAAESLPRSVLVFDFADTNSPWGLAFRSTLRSEMGQGSKTPVALYSEVSSSGGSTARNISNC